MSATLLEPILLADGSRVELRTAGPDDREVLLALHAGLSRESRYLRYHSPHPRLTERELYHYSHVDQRDHAGLLAFIGDEIAAHALYDRRRDDPAEAEFGIEVADRFQGLGLGTALLERLAGLARAAGMQRLIARVMPENHKMMQVLRDLGFGKRARREGSVLLVALDLDDLAGLARARRRREAHSSKDTLAD